MSTLMDFRPTPIPTPSQLHPGPMPFFARVLKTQRYLINPPNPHPNQHSQNPRPLSTAASSSIPLSFHSRNLLVNRAQQLGLEDVLALLVLLRRLKRLVVLPADRPFTLPAVDIVHDMPARRHAALYCLGLGYVDNCVEEEGFPMLTAEVLAQRKGKKRVSLTVFFSSDGWKAGELVCLFFLKEE